ncbi:LysE family translocator [Halobacillus sp. A5]|uniref:LysE family translocator n=1 Tax=Halobacillus sp. A5 TaxID=2880263 RepID=UPI0020A6D8A4|nr:LysE family transporter [Halobacillus sp. A5]MCP3027164.1 LysE family translocator [Halobacillus sp. A5]
MLKLLLSGFFIGFASSPTCPSNGEEIKHGTKYGFFSSLMVGLGAVFGDAVVLAAILLWLMPLINENSLVITLLWLVGGGVLLYVAMGIFKEMKTVESVGTASNESAALPGNHFLKAFWTGAVITTFNPFTFLWWVGLLTPMMGSENDLHLSYPLAVIGGALAWFVLLACLLHLGERWLTRKRRQVVLFVSGSSVLFYSVYFFIQFAREVI